MYIKNISITKNKELLTLNQCNIIKDFGIEGDDKGGKALRELSLYLIPAKDLVAIKNGLCINKFNANLNIANYNDEEIKIGTLLKIGSSTLIANSVGKKCYPNCNLVKEALPCPLKNNVIFCSVLEEGIISVNDNILIN